MACSISYTFAAENNERLFCNNKKIVMEKNNLLNIVQEIKKFRVQEMDSSHVEKPKFG